MLNQLRHRVRAVLLRRRLEREMQQEMADHVRRATERLVARGLSEAEARREALREFGNVALLEDEARDARGTGWLESLLADGRYALRQYARRPATTATMFVVLAAGMCITTLLFSFVHSYAVQPPPAVTREADLVRIRGSQTAGIDGRLSRSFSEEEFLGYRTLGDQFASVAGWTESTLPLVAGGDAERRALEARTTFVTPEYFSVLGVRSVLGPGLPAEAADDASASGSMVAVIGHAAWQTQFGGSPSLIGSTVSVNGIPVTIVGVAPERFNGPGLAYHPLRLWMPHGARRVLVPADPVGAFRAAARLRPGVDPAEASAAVQVVVDRIAATDEQLRELEPGADVVPLLSANGDPMFERDVQMMSFATGLLGLLVLLVTCTNVSALLTGLATARRQEIAVRISLGADRRRLVRQLLTESALLATAAGATALGLVWLALHLATRMIPALPFEMGITWPVVAFAFGIALAVGIGFGVSPALHATRLALASVLRDANGATAATRARLQRGLVVAQIAFTQPLIVLLVGVLFMVMEEFRPRRATDVADRLVAVSLPFSVRAGPNADSLIAAETRRTRAGIERLAERLRATPGIETVVPEWGGGREQLGAYVVSPADRVAGTTGEALQLSSRRVGPGFLEAMEVPVVRGRSFRAGDIVATGSGATETPAVIVVDLARRLWGDADPIGRRLDATFDSAGSVRSLVVVGVIDPPLSSSNRRSQSQVVHLPPDTTFPARSLLVRTSHAAQPLVPAVAAMVREEIPETVVQVRTLADIEEEAQRMLRIVTGGISAAGIAALFLSAIGLYAVVAFAVSQRTREIAVRMAVGARGRQVASRFVTDGLRLSAIGLVLGLPASLVGLRFVFSLDNDFPDVNLATVTAIAALGVAVVATTAAWLPARKAAAVDPAVALRAE